MLFKLLFTATVAENMPAAIAPSVYGLQRPVTIASRLRLPFTPNDIIYPAPVVSDPCASRTKFDPCPTHLWT